MGKKSRGRSPAGIMLGHALVILLATLALYHGAFDNPLFGDSKNTVTPEILASPVSIMTVFGRRGVSFLSFPLIANLAGIDPYWQHAANALLHAITAIAVYFFARKLYGMPSDSDASARVHGRLALAAALLFALHPAAVYATGYLIQRSIVLATLFSLLGTLLFLQGLKKNRQLWFLASGIAYFLAVHAKEHAVMLPGVLLVIAFAYWRGRDLPWRDGVKIILPMLVLCLVVAVDITSRTDTTLTHGTLEGNLVVLMPVAQEFAPGLSGKSLLALSAISQSWLFFTYWLVWLCPWAAPLALEIPAVFPSSYWHWPQSLGPLLYGAFPLVAIGIARRFKGLALPASVLLAPWLFFWTEFTTVRLSEQFVIYRSYLLMPFVIPLAPWFLHRLLPVARKAAIPLLLIPLLVLLALKARERLTTFDSEVALWRDALKITTAENEASYKLYRTHFYLASALEHDASRNGNTGQIREAVEHYMETLALNPDHVPSLVNLAGIHIRGKNTDTAESLLAKAVHIEPRNATVHVAIGALNDARGLTEEALHEYLTALELDPGMEMAHINAGNALKRLERIDEAITHFEAVVEANPGNMEARKKLELLKAEKGRSSYE